MTKTQITEAMIAAYVDNELSLADRNVVRKELLINREARDLYEKLLRTKQLFNSALGELGADEFAHKLESQIRTSPRIESSRVFKWTLPTSMAASMLLGVGLTVLTMNQYQSADTVVAQATISELEAQNANLLRSLSISSDRKASVSDQTSIIAEFAEHQVDPLSIVANTPPNIVVNMLPSDTARRISLVMQIAKSDLTDSENKRLPDAAGLFKKGIRLVSNLETARENKRSFAEAETYFSKAAEKGHKTAKIALAELTGSEEESLAAYRAAFGEKK